MIRISGLAPPYDAYDHADLKGSVEPVVRDIQRLLSRDVGRATRLDLVQVRQNSYLAQVPDRNLFRDATFVVEVESSRALTLVQQQFPLSVQGGAEHPDVRDCEQQPAGDRVDPYSDAAKADPGGVAQRVFHSGEELAAVARVFDRSGDRDALCRAIGLI